MKLSPSLPVMLAGAVLAVGCASPAARVDHQQRKPWPDAGTPVPYATAIPETRYYRDDKGELWDDRGRRHERAEASMSDGAR